MPELDDLVDHVGGLALLLVLVGHHVFFARNHSRVETGGIDRLRIGGGDMHRDQPAERVQSRQASPDDSSATRTPILPRPSETELCM